MSPETFKRKLTAILSADVKGYSRLMGTDEWDQRHLIAVNPSEEFSYEDLEHIGKLIGKSYQSIYTFFDQKRYGYLSPNISFSEFKAQVESFGTEKFPFFVSEGESEGARAELMQMISKKD